MKKCKFAHPKGKNITVYSINMALMEISKQELLDRRYLRMATIWAENSYCVRRQVGALLVKDDMIISDGYNDAHQGLRMSVRMKMA